jgi:hypothetical protein
VVNHRTRKVVLVNIDRIVLLDEILDPFSQRLDLLLVLLVFLDLFPEREPLKLARTF